MGHSELAFGKSFDMLSSGKEHFAIQLLHEGTVPIGLFTPAPWLFIILSKIPFLSAGFLRFINFCNDQVENRKKVRRHACPDAARDTDPRAPRTSPPSPTSCHTCSTASPWATKRRTSSG